MHNEKRYDTREKRIEFLNRKGSIITFKNPFYPVGSKTSRTQIIAIKIYEPDSGGIRILGLYCNSDVYNSLDELLDAIDWDEMEIMHSF